MKAMEALEEGIKNVGNAIVEESKKRLAEEIYGKENVHRILKIAIIGSSGMYPEMKEHEMEMTKRGYVVWMPKLDWHADDVENLVDHNKKRIQDADEIHLFWDGRSPGTILDLGMVIAFNKPLKIMKLEQKSISEYVQKYVARFDSDPECGYCHEKLTTETPDMKYCKICRRVYFKGSRTGLWRAASPTQYVSGEGDGYEKSI